ncbi:LysM peptidoglycan-binding domain-containing protein [Cohnella lupini]|uniref:LysM domain-containing protein n=1 Tax=Cohnella lupini TaxID=1294267 RepID=A0A3D9ISB5_9BACL|nr:LysM peptidoglycan-binding domain-containing protein [Cohnella lupini]RED64673.1 LysM domain-containing protein [Cohnella lupini]
MAETEYKLSLSTNDQEEGFLFPILPDSIEINEQGNGKIYEISGSGPINVIQPSSLSKISFNGYFHIDPFHSSAKTVLKPMQYVTLIRDWMNSGKPLRLIYVGNDVEINLPVSIESFDWKEVAGTPGDIEYSVKLLKYVYFAPKKVTISSTTAESNAAKNNTTRPDERVKPTTYKIAAGDTLIRIARKMLGDDARWREIQKLNSITDSQIKTLRIGSILKLPKRR